MRSELFDKGSKSHLMRQEHFRVILTLSMLTALGPLGCSAEIEFPIPENQFCTTIELGRSNYAEAKTNSSPKDTERVVSEIRAQRKKEMLGILPGGAVLGWSVKIKNLITHDEDAQVELELPCYDVLFVDENLAPQSDVFQALHALFQLTEDQDVVIFGVLEPNLPKEPDAFQELSGTESDSLSKPRFRIHIKRVFSRKSSLSEEQLREAHQAIESYTLAPKPQS